MPTNSRQRQGRSKRSQAPRNSEQLDVPKPRRYDYVTNSLPRMLPNTAVFRTTTITETGAGLTQTAVSNATASYTFQLNDIDNVSSFVALFDQYRIAGVEIMFEPVENAIQLVDPTVTSPGILYTVIDYDNATSLATLTAARQYANCCEVAPGKSCIRSFVPRQAIASYSGAFTSFANDEPHWIDSTSQGVLHYGIKAIVSGGLVGQTLLSKWVVKRKYFLEFRNIY